MKRKAIFLLYRVSLALFSPAILVYLLFRSLRDRRYFSTLGERCGALHHIPQQTLSAAIWLHAVSVGEVLAAVTVIREVRKRMPAAPVFVSTGTLAGRAMAEKQLTGLADGVFHAPLDFVWAVRRVLRRLRPSVVVILETEIWPNLFMEAKRIGCGLIILNGRISDQTLPRYRRWRGVFGEVLGLCDRIVAQSEEMKRRFEAAGAPADVVRVGGNLKYDLAPAAATPETPPMKFIGAMRERPLWIAASTSADNEIVEESFVIAAQRQLEGWRLVMAPRKPERFEDMARLLAASGLRWTRRSALSDPEADILLLDSIGELNGLFAFASVVFMGGTLARRGGHNILEPAICGKPVIAGPHMENFRDIAQHFEQSRALLRIQSGEQLADAVLRCLSDPGLGERGRAAAEAHGGAAARAADQVLELYDSCYPRRRDSQPIYGLLWILSLIWKAGSGFDRRAKTRRAARLPIPVVSVGNITAGGTGKTPVSIELLREFEASKPGLLTRGYGRHTRDDVLILGENRNMPLSLTGDEAQLYMRATSAAIGIGSNRYETGKQLLAAEELRLLFLDDGFQHLQLHRDFDLVLIDALNPFGGGHLLPLGRLREPLTGLARGSAFIVTRADEAPNIRAIEAILRHFNAAAPVFRARTIARKWVGPNGAEMDPAFFNDKRAVAFCGLGNPDAFWKTLRHTGVKPVACYEYDDHHRYTPAEIRRLARNALDSGAEALLTTAKDAVNLDEDYPSMIGSLKLFWLEISTEIEGQAALANLIRQRI